MDRTTIDTWSERALLALVLGILIFAPLALGAVRASEFVVLQWLMLAALAVWLVRLCCVAKVRFLLPPSAWAVLPFILYAVWRYRTADIEYVARQEFIQVVLAAVLFLVIVNNLYSQTSIRIIVICLVVLGTLVATYGVYQWMTDSDYVWHFKRPGYRGRGSGTYICPNHLAGFLEMICPLAITFTVLRGFGIVARILFAYASFVMLVGIAATASRGGWLSISVAILVLALVLIRSKTHLWVVLALLMAVGGTGKWLYSRILEPRLYSTPEKQFQTDDIRFQIWASARQMWKDHPWVGLGPDHFDYRYRGYRPAHWSLQPRPGRAHNDYWNTLVDWGLAGLVLVLLPVVVTGVGVLLMWRYLRRAGEASGNRISVVLGASIGIAALLVHSFFDFNMHIPANALLAATLLAIIATHWRFASQRYWITARWPVRLLGALILAGTGFYLGAQTLRHTSETLALRRADRARVASKERMAALQEAARAEPRNAETASAIGEELRLRSWTGGDDYESLALEALRWFQRAAELNSWDPQALIRAGMCLDWLGRHDEAGPYFSKAIAIDPNHWYARGMMGWHCFQMENFGETRRWMERSLEVEGANNSLAVTYLDMAKKELAGQSNQNSAFQSLPKAR